MFPTKDGQRKFGSAFRAKKYDSFHPASEEPNKNEHSPVVDAAEGKDAAGEQNAEGHDPKQVVAEHGKAHSVHIHHNHAEGKHKVVSHHEDGHMHEKEFENAGAAHDEAKKLSGSDEDVAENEAPAGDSDEAESSNLMV